MTLLILHCTKVVLRNVERLDIPIVQEMWSGCKKSLYIIYFTSITQKAQGFYKRIHEGAGVAVVWSNKVEESG